MLSLRWRLVAVALGVASVGLITANLVVYGEVRRDLNGRIDRQLTDFSGRRLLVRAVEGADANDANRGRRDAAQSVRPEDEQRIGAAADDHPFGPQ